MKFDLPNHVVDGILAVMQEAPVPHKIVNPLVQELWRQSKDDTIQSLSYPKPEKPAKEKSVPVRKRGRPAKLTNGAQEQTVM